MSTFLPQRMLVLNQKLYAKIIHSFTPFVLTCEYPRFDQSSPSNHSCSDTSFQPAVPFCW